MVVVPSLEPVDFRETAISAEAALLELLSAIALFRLELENNKMPEMASSAAIAITTHLRVLLSLSQGIREFLQWS